MPTTIYHVMREYDQWAPGHIYAAHSLIFHDLDAIRDKLQGGLRFLARASRLPKTRPIKTLVTISERSPGAYFLMIILERPPSVAHDQFLKLLKSAFAEFTTRTQRMDGWPLAFGVATKKLFKFFLEFNSESEPEELSRLGRRRRVLGSRVRQKKRNKPT